ncbi:MAG: hypothetical protein ACYS80_16875 [Planctomycetota bacterium]|jgi:uncharacterized membrane protein YqjE
MNMIILLLCFLLIVVLAIYWTLWKVRGELVESLEKIRSVLDEVRKLLEGKADKA